MYTNQLILDKLNNKCYFYMPLCTYSSSSSSIRIIESFLLMRIYIYIYIFMHLCIPNSDKNKNQFFFNKKKLFIMRFSYIFLITYALNAIKVN